MDIKPLELSSGFARVVKTSAVGKTGRVFMVAMGSPLGEANYVILLNKSRDREAVKAKMQKERKAKGIACNRGMNNRGRQSWWACWGFKDKKAASLAFPLCVEGVIRGKVTANGKTVSLFDDTHKDRAKRFFVAHSKYKSGFIDELEKQ